MGSNFTRDVGDHVVNHYITHEKLPGDVVKTTYGKALRTELRVLYAFGTLGITEAIGSCDYLTYKYSYGNRTLGASENEASEKAYEIGCDYFKQGKYKDAKQWFHIAHVTCKSGYCRESLFRHKKNEAKEKLEEQQREKVRREKEQQKQQESEIRKKIERKAQKERLVEIRKYTKELNAKRQRELIKPTLALEEVARKNCEDTALHGREKHTVLFYSADVFRKQSQIEVKDIPDSFQFTEVSANNEECADAGDDEEKSGINEVDNTFEGTELQEMNEIDVRVERLLQLTLQNTEEEITTFQEQMFYMSIYRILDAVNNREIDLVRMFEAICEIVTTNSMSIHDFFSIAILVISSSQLQKSLCSEQTTHLNELKSTWLQHMLTMKSIEYNESDVRTFLNVATKFDFSFFVFTTQKLLRFYTKFKDLHDFFDKLQKCRLTNKSKQDFVQTLTEGSSPLHLLAKSLVENYFSRKFSYTKGQQKKSLQTFEFDPSYRGNFVPIVLQAEKELEKMFELSKIMAKQFAVHWNFSYVEKLLGLIDEVSKIKAMATCLLHVNDFEGSSPLLATEELLHILEKKEPVSWTSHPLLAIGEKLEARSWTNMVHEELVERAFPQADYSLKDELKKLNVFEQFTHFDFDGLHNFLMSENPTILLTNCPAINTLRKEDIMEWSKSVRSGASGVSLYEIIAVVNRAVYLHSKHLPREVQNMALLLLLDKMESNKGGRLLQVNTGEGKTLIVAMFAVAMALKGHVVDVITSSPELAKPQCQKMSFFYEYFQLTAAYVTPYCADNIREEAYKADIVYGAAQDFQGDILRDEYSQLGTRSGRIFDIAIVDEVDSMLIDGRNHLVMLSSPVPGMENLEALLATIWNHINLIESRLIEKNGRVYLVDECNRINEDGSLKSEEECIDNALPIEQTKLEFIKQETENFMRMLLRDYTHLDDESKEVCKDLPEMPVPHHLREFVLNVQLPKWIDSAIFAKYAYKINQHYIIKGSEIFPVDASNTGVVQANMHISNGIHQFLQIKHGAKISPETYTTNYISNVAFFKRYGKRLFGLTGTLGSNSAHELLKKMYEVDSVILPPFKMKQYRQLSSLFADDKDEWLLTTAQSCMRQLEIGRAVLVITQYLSEVDMLKERLQLDGLDESKIHLYKTEEHSDVVQRELQSGEIIIATNIAGRGTDISVSKKVEKRGGLHVCLTFLPVNERVEIQNFGRTSRTGNRGTGQYVVLRGVNASWEEVKRTRDEIERNRLLEAEAEIQKVLIKDAIFVAFCALLKRIRIRFENKSKLECETNVRSVEERFGLWVKENEDKLESEKDFQPFCEIIKQELESDTFIKNPYFHVLKGNIMLDQEDFNSAIIEYTRAIGLDDRFMSNAYYNRGYCRIVLYSKFYKKETADEAIEDFKKAKEIIEGRLERDLLVIQQSAPSSEALSEQVKHMMTLYDMQKSAIECAVGKGKDFVKMEIKRVRKDTKASKDKVKQFIAQLDENKVRHEVEVIGEVIQNGNGIKVILNSIESSLRGKEIAAFYESKRATIGKGEDFVKMVFEKLKKVHEDMVKRYIAQLEGNKVRYQVGFIGAEMQNSNGIDVIFNSIESSLPWEEMAILYERNRGTLGIGKDFVKMVIKKLKKDTKTSKDKVKQFIAQLEEKKICHDVGVIGEVIKNGNGIKVILNSIESSLPGEEIAALYESNRDTISKGRDFVKMAIEKLKNDNNAYEDKVKRYIAQLEKNKVRFEVGDFGEKMQNGNVIKVILNPIESSLPGEEIAALYESHRDTIRKGKHFVKIVIEKLKKDNEAYKDKMNQYTDQLEKNKVRHEVGVIGEAMQNGNGISVILNPIESSLPKEERVSLYAREIDTFRNNGNLGSFEVKLIKPIAWWSVIGVILIGIAQMVAGAAIAVFSVGAGAAIGLGMLTEGVTDLITSVVDGLINRDFSWASWGVQKAVSYAVSIACAGLSALKNAAKVAFQGVKQTVKGVTKGLTAIAKTGWKLAAKKIGLELSKGVAKKMITAVADYTLNCTAMPMIEKLIKDKIHGRIMEMVDTNADVALLLDVDRTNRNAHYQQQIIQKAMQILHPDPGESSAALVFLGGLQQFVEGVASNKIEGLSEVIMVVKMEKSLVDVIKLLPEFVEALKTKVASMANKYRDDKDSQQGTKCSNLPVKDEQVKLEKIHSSCGDLTEQLCQDISSTICNMISGKLISPLLSLGVSKSVDSVTAKMNNSLNKSLEVFKSRRRLIMLQDEDRHGMIDKKYKQGTKDKNATEKVRQIIDNLENGGEAGLPMLGAISDTINRQITVLDSNGLPMMHIGEDKTGGDPVFAQYREPTDSQPGHWTCPNNTEPKKHGKSSNNCLFAVIAEQIHMDPDQLRDSVCATLKTDKHLNLLACGIRDIAHLENFKEKYLLYGGYIEYKLANKEEAKDCIEISQGKYSLGKGGKKHRTKNHPHGHVTSGISEEKRHFGIDCLENYSFQVKDERYAKTGVTSKDIQAELVHDALSSSEGQAAIAKMNDPNETEAERLEQCIRVPIPPGNNIMVKMTRDKKLSCTPKEFEVRIRHPLDVIENPKVTKYEKQEPPEGRMQRLLNDTKNSFTPDIFTAFPCSETGIVNWFELQ